jgi:hypothetical protein
VSAPPLPAPLPPHTYKFKRFGVSAFPDKKFPVEAVPSLATRQLLYKYFYKFKSFYGNPEILFNLATLHRGSLSLSRKEPCMLYNSRYKFNKFPCGGSSKFGDNTIII